jgi:hypothetical protein
LEHVGANRFVGCESLSVITAVPNRVLEQLIGPSFSGGGLESLCISASVVEVDWSWICRYAGTIGITFESPCRVREISNLNPGSRASFSVPDLVEVLTLSRGGDRGFVCDFGRNSQLRDLRNSSRIRQGFGFMRLSELSVKRIRDMIEWKTT